MQTGQEGDRGRVVVNAFDQNGEPLPFLNLVASVTTPDNKSLRVPLRQTGMSTYEADFPAGGIGRYQVAVTGAPGDNPQERVAAYGGLSVPRSAEMEKLAADTAFLNRLAEKGGGRILTGDPEKDDIFNRDLPPASGFQDLWRWLLILAAALFPLDVFVRRVMIDWSAAASGIKRTMATWRGKKTEKRDEKIGRLVEIKREVARERDNKEFIEKLAGETGTDRIDLSGKTEAKPVAPQKIVAEKTVDKPAPQEDTYTSRLLKAKKRAQNDRNKS